MEIDPRLGIAFWFAVVITIGVVGAFQYRAHLQSMRRVWRTANGLVVWSLVKEEMRARPLEKRARMGYAPDIRYKYSVGSREYESTRIYTGDAWSRDSRVAGTLVDRYPPGAKVKVLVDPQDSAMAVLERGDPQARETGIRMMVTAGAMIVVALIFVIGASRG